MTNEELKRLAIDLLFLIIAVVVFTKLLPLLAP